MRDFTPAEVKITRTWLVRLQVPGAPDTPSDYSPGITVRPETLELTYVANNGGQPSWRGARLVGKMIGSNGQAKTNLVNAYWHEASHLPAWISALVYRYRPERG